jgi:PAS domain S-box-containing protein
MTPNHDHGPSWVAALKIATVYAIIGALWILCFGWLLRLFVNDASMAAILEYVKGGFYVLATAVLLGWWLNVYFRKIRSATELLRKSETRFASIFNHHLEAISISRLRDGVFVDVNEAFARLHGYTREEIVGRTSEQLQLWHFPNRRQVIAELREKKSLLFEMQARRKDGDVRSLMVSAQLTELDGEACLLGTLIDLTERKRTEAALQETEDRLRFALETSHTGAWDMDLADHAAFRSLEHDRIFGYEKLLPAWTYEMFLEHVLPEDRATVSEKFQRATETQSDWTFECRIRRVDGQVRWVWAAGRHRIDANGKARRMAGIVQDITQRKAHEREIERLSQLYATLSQINQAIVRVGTLKELIGEVTRIVIEIGGFKLAWVGEHNPQTGEVTPLSYAGEPGELVRDFRHSSTEDRGQRCPCGLAIRDNHSFVLNDLSAELGMRNWQSVMEQAGIGAVVVFPVRVRGAVWGVLGVYASEPGVFRDRETALLEEAALDIGYAIEHIDNETQRRQAEKFQLLSTAILGVLNEPLTLREASSGILGLIKEETGLDAVGIRLKGGDDFPYFSADGFDKEFLLAENSVILRSETGAVCRDADGQLCLQCTCGMVLAGKCGPPSDSVTAAGSIWTNDTLATLEALRGHDPRLKPRNRCVHEGFRSVALIPICADEQVIGLLHLNDRRKNRFTLEMIRFFEGLAASFGIAVKRKWIEDASRESEARFRALFEQAAVGVAEIESSTGRYLRVNQRYCDIVGYSQEEMLCLDFQTITHPDDRAAELAQMEQIKAGTTSEFAIEKRCQRKNGAVVWVAKTVSPLWPRGDLPTRYIAVVQDISERKEAEKALHESENLLNEVGSIALIGGWKMDLITRRATWTRGTYEIVEIDPGKQVPGPDEHVDYYLPEYRPMIAEAMRALIEDDKPLDFEAKLRTAKGNIKWCRAIGKAIRKDGTALQVYGTFQDVTERKRSEEALRRSEAHLRTLVDTLPDLVWLKDPQGVYLACNTRFESFFGAPEADVVGKTDYDFFDRELSDFFRANDSAAVAAGGPRMNEEEVTFASDGHREFLETIKTPMFDADGGLIGVLGIARDITKRKKAEDEIQKLNTTLEQLNADLESKVKERTVQLEAANKELEAFSYSVSHDLRAPLRHINGYVDMLNEGYREDLDDKARHCLDTIVGASRQMGTLIDDLLQFSRSGRQELTKTELDFNTLLQEVVEELKPAVQGRKIAWDIQELPKVLGDHALLKLVWTNLLDNAVKYTRNQQVARISVGYELKAKDYVFCVRDNGVGFNMKYAHKLFGVFQRLHSQTAFEGTGIGLANVQRIIHKHSGEVWAEAKPGKGAAFYFRLPRIREGGNG